MRSSANLIVAISVALILHAGLCPALCFARGAEAVSAELVITSYSIHYTKLYEFTPGAVPSELSPKL